MSAQRRRIEYIRCVDYKAEELDKQGYNVKANIGGWSTPPTILGMIPDLRAKRGNKVIIGKMVREDFDINAAEFTKFMEYAKKDENTSFRVYLISETGKPTLYKIY
ncbi:hypothetical protein ACFL0D_01985 [Thermoproteota archaeon]